MHLSDRWLVTLAMAMSALGIVCLLFALILMQPEEVDLSEARAMEDGSYLAVRGEVVRTRDIGNRTIITITAPATIDILIDETKDLPEGACIRASGKRSSYNGAPQVDATKVEGCDR
jgi:hypothetical protein